MDEGPPTMPGSSFGFDRESWLNGRAWAGLVPALLVATALVTLRARSPLGFYDHRFWFTLAAVAAMLVASWGATSLLRAPILGKAQPLILLSALVLLFGFLAPAAWEADEHVNQVPVPEGWTRVSYGRPSSLLGCLRPCTLKGEYAYPRAMAEAGAIRDPWLMILDKSGWTIDHVGDAQEPTGRAPSCWSACAIHGKQANLELFGLVEAEHLTATIVLG